MKNPYEKVVHKGHLINQRGGVSALCFEKPRSVDLKIATWVMGPENFREITCKKCLVKIREDADAKLKPFEDFMTQEFGCTFIDVTPESTL